MSDVHGPDPIVRQLHTGFMSGDITFPRHWESERQEVESALHMSTIFHLAGHSNVITGVVLRTLAAQHAESLSYIMVIAAKHAGWYDVEET